MLPQLTRAALLVLAIEAPIACRTRDSAIVISEFLAANGSGLADADGETSDWIELHNQGSTAVELAGWCLTDNPHEPTRWCFPEVSIPAAGYLLVFASGKQPASTGAQLHASFKLKATEDYLALLDPRGNIAHEFSPYPDQKDDVSYGLTSTGLAHYLSHPTPGAPNQEARR